MQSENNLWKSTNNNNRLLRRRIKSSRRRPTNAKSSLKKKPVKEQNYKRTSKNWSKRGSSLATSSNKRNLKQLKNRGSFSWTWNRPVNCLTKSSSNWPKTWKRTTKLYKVRLIRKRRIWSYKIRKSRASSERLKSMSKNKVNLILIRIKPWVNSKKTRMILTILRIKLWKRFRLLKVRSISTKMSNWQISRRSSKNWTKCKTRQTNFKIKTSNRYRKS